MRTEALVRYEEFQFMSLDTGPTYLLTQIEHIPKLQFFIVHFEDFLPVLTVDAISLIGGFI